MRPYVTPYTMLGMKKTSLYLEDADVERLRRLAVREGRTQSDIVRSAIAAYGEPIPDRHFAVSGTFEGDGTSIADVPKEELLDGFGL
jgi:predicted DNA-binding protein